MALRFREVPWYVQTVLYFLVAVGLVAAGEGLEISPVKQARDEEARLEQQLRDLTDKVAGLQAAEQRREDLRTRLEAAQTELATLRMLVPEEKQTDEFMRLLQGAAGNTQVAMRRLTSQSVVIKEFYAEMPFEVEIDAGYYDMLEFFRRLGGTTRIVNASALELEGIDKRRQTYDYRPGTTVGAVCTVTTYYTPSEAELAAAAPPAAGAARQ